MLGCTQATREGEHSLLPCAGLICIPRLSSVQPELWLGRYVCACGYAWRLQRCQWIESLVNLAFKRWSRLDTLVSYPTLICTFVVVFSCVSFFYFVIFAAPLVPLRQEGRTHATIIHTRTPHTILTRTPTRCSARSGERSVASHRSRAERPAGTTI